MKTIVTPAIFTRFSSRVDGSIGFGGCTPELNGVEKCAMFDLQNKNVRLLIEPVDFSPEAKLTVKTEIGLKTPSERLRGILFALYKQETEGQQEPDTFDIYYERQMNKLCEHFKTKLK